MQVGSSEYTSMRVSFQALLDSGADLGAVNVHGWTPLHFAAAYNQDERIVAALLDAGADPAAVTLQGDTAATWARDGGARKLIEDALTTQK